MAKSKKSAATLSSGPLTIDDLDERLSRPSPQLIEFLGRLQGDILILGVGGKMGPSLAELAVRGLNAAKSKSRVIGVSGFSQRGVQRQLEKIGVVCHKADLLQPGELDKLPDAPNVLQMIGKKFGSTGAEWDTWNTNVFLIGQVARRFRKSRVVAFSSGNIYPFVGIGSGGCDESTPPGPVGEYAMTCLGRERMFDLAANEFGARVVHYRLNYANELRYGIIHDIAQKVWNKLSIDVTMGHVNLVWQGYANSVAIQCLDLATAPANILNVAGPETVSVRWLASQLAKRMKREITIVGDEAPNALLNNATKCHGLFGYPDVSLNTLIDWVAAWVMRGGASLGKPTHYATRDGKF